jgi:hypothetical protein
MSKSLSLDCYGNLCPIGNISSKLQLYLFTGDNLSAPKSNGVDLDLMVPDQCTGFDLSEKALNYVPKFNFTKAGKLVFSNVVYDCDQSETKDLFQIGMVVNSKLHALTKRHVMKILNFHILADKFSYKAWIHAGKFDTKGVLKAGSAFSKDRVDSFAKGLFLWKPLTYAENGIPTSGAWYKVSVMGKLFEIFSSNASDVSNLLCDYCVIFYKGVSFLWRQEPLTSPFAHFEKPSLSCPVSLEEISVTHVDKSLVPPLNKKKSRIERLLTPKNSPSEHVLTYSDLNDTQVLSGRPWFFSGCGFFCFNPAMCFPIFRANCLTAIHSLVAACAEKREVLCLSQFPQK